MIIDVHCEYDTTQVAKVVHNDGETYIVKFLEKRSSNKFCFSTIEETITKDMISGFYDVENLEDTGHYMKEREGVFVAYDESDDEDFVCPDDESDESDESDDSISLDDEDVNI